MSFHKMATDNNDQSGNVLFLILIAVALFAALSYAVTQSTSGGGDARKESNSIIIGQISQYVASIDAAITKIKILNGCDNLEISFERSPFDGSSSYFNPNSPSNFKCHVFHPSGGGAFHSETAPAGNGWMYGKNFGVRGSTMAEAIMVTRGFDRELCLEISKTFAGLNYIPYYSNVSTVGNGAVDGTYSTNPAYLMLRDTSNSILNGSDRPLIGCAENRNYTDSYAFYSTMLIN